jgi:hypothetical protein
MFRRGKSSWRFSTDLNGRLHAALFVRDALDLPVTSGAAIPPRLDGDIPELRDRISAQARTDAAAAWPAWWDTLVRFELRQDQVAGDPVMIRQRLGELAHDHDVDIGAIRGSAQVLLVGGRWWTLTQSGGVLCSAAVAEHEATARHILRLVFESTVGG